MEFGKNRLIFSLRMACEGQKIILPAGGIEAAICA